MYQPTQAMINRLGPHDAHELVYFIMEDDPTGQQIVDWLHENGAETVHVTTARAWKRSVAGALTVPQESTQPRVTTTRSSQPSTRAPKPSPSPADPEEHAITIDTTNDGDAAEELKNAGLNPQEWELEKVRTSRWTMATGEEGVSRRYGFQRKAIASDRETFLQELSNVSRETLRETTTKPSPEEAATGVTVIPIADTQFGKAENRLSNVLGRALAGVRARMDELYARNPTPDLYVPFLGDHIEGFQSQGGKNIFRTPMTLREQIELAQALMVAVVELADAWPGKGEVHVSAVPGNHGECHRVGGSGMTRYDDNHDSGTLATVAKIYAASGRDRIQFHLPAVDELSVAVRAGETNFYTHHGHSCKPGGFFDWWKKQAFHDDVAANSDVALTGHYHHTLVQRDGERLHIQAPALETDSAWFRHVQGSPGAPGVIGGTFVDGVCTHLTGV